MRTFLLLLLAGILSWRFLPIFFRRRAEQWRRGAEPSDPLGGEKIQEADFEELEGSEKERP